MSKSGLANRLYRGEAGLNLIGKRKIWFGVAGALILVALLSFGINRFTLGIEFAGGNQFIVPSSNSVSLTEAQSAIDKALSDTNTGATALPAQQVGRGGETWFEVRTSILTPEQTTAVTNQVAKELGVQPSEINSSRVSPAWGSQVTERAILGLVIFVALVMVYLILRFEWRMAVAAVSSLLLNLVLTAGLYSLAGCEVTPATIIGFLTILGFALYDVVVVFDKVQENTRGITASNTQTYGDAADLAINQTLMRSINTGLVALLPVGGLLIAGLSGASTLADLGLVLFVGMAIAVYSSIFFATPVLVTLKDFEPRIQAHTKRVLARRAALARGEIAPKKGEAVPAGAARQPRQASPENASESALAGSAPKVGARPAAAKRSGNRGGRPGGNRPGGKRR